MTMLNEYLIELCQEFLFEDMYEYLDSIYKN
jgi:hypothetical protein